MERVVYFISDSTGETLTLLGRAVLSQFLEEPRSVRWNEVKTKRRVLEVFKEIERLPGIIITTVVKKEIQEEIERRGRELGLQVYGVLGPLMVLMEGYLCQVSKKEPGRQHSLDVSYFRKIEAIEFCVNHDDGKNLRSIGGAEVILVGVSRTSKTPTCLYLANKGVRAANVPFVLEEGFPEEVLREAGCPVIGLMVETLRLREIRKKRFDSIGVKASNRGNSYTREESIEEEVTRAKRMFNRNGWISLNVTYQSVEETASQIFSFLEKRKVERGG